MSDRQSFTQAVYDYLTARPGVWVDSSRLEKIGGRMAWRTRVSDVRIRLKAEGNGTVENRQRRYRQHEGACQYLIEACDCETFVISEYRYVPSESVTVRVEDNGQAAFL